MFQDNEESKMFSNWKFEKKQLELLYYNLWDSKEFYLIEQLEKKPENKDIENIILSFKSSNVLETISVNKIAKKEFKFPLHIGITEAGDFIDGAIKYSV